MSYVYTRLKNQQTFSTRGLALVFFMSFLQGWMSFDYAFVATLYPLAMASGWWTKRSRRSMVWATLAAGLGFTFAHLLHLEQLHIYYGSFEQAYSELLATGSYRMNGASGAGKSVSRFDLLRVYLLQGLPSQSHALYFSWILPVVAAVSAIVAFVTSLIWRQGESQEHRCTGALLSLAFSLIVSALWICVMSNHAYEPGHRLFLPRHFLVLMFACLVLIADNLVYTARQAEVLLGSSARRRTSSQGDSQASNSTAR